MTPFSKPDDKSDPDFNILDDARLQVRTLPSPALDQETTESLGEEFDLKEVLDQQRIQAIMDDFHSLTGMVTAIVDLEGNILESTGWQELCTRFHRAHPVTSRYCTESDLALAETLEPGQYADYHCKNGLRDVVTPLYIRNHHVGNIYTGQFFYEDDAVDEARFIEQARRHGFAEEEYLEALRRIPRYSRETIAHLMGFLVRMTEHISQIGLKNLELARESRFRQAAESGWHDSRARLQAVIHSIPDLVWMKDPDGVYLLCNGRFEQFFGAPASDILGKTDADFLPPEQVAFFRDHDNRAMELDRPTMNIEEVKFASDGHREILETIKTPLRDENGNISGVLGIGRDISARMEAEQDLRENEEKLRDAQRMESIGRLAAGVSHDLNNLLTPILGYTEVLASGLGPESPHQETLAHISYAGGRAKELISQLVAFARKQTLQYRTVDLNGSARNLLKLLDHSLRPNINVRLELDDSLPHIRADEAQIEQVVMNLALNAVDAMPAGGDLVIATTANQAPDTLGDYREALPWVRLEVHDTGTGMDRETMSHIFEPFFSTKGKLGTGLGLATVHGIIKQHGGEVVVESEPGRGTSFLIYLPALEPNGEQPPVETLEEDGSDPVPSEPAESDGPATILVVEDDENVRCFATTILARKGYQVLSAGSSEEALSLIETLGTPIDLLLTDMVMPGISGQELCSRMMEVQPGLPVLFMSGYSDLDMSRDWECCPGEAFLSKPFLPEQLLSSINGLLARARSSGKG